MRIDYVLKNAAKRMTGVFVDVDSSMGTVCISTNGQDDIFMQGDDADQFIAECESLANRCKHLSPAIIELALAEPYAECIWS